VKIFLDTANRTLIEQWLPTGLVDGVTTNPTLLSKEGPDTKKVLLDICAMVPGHVSIEVVEKSPEDVYRQALEISKFAPNVVVKIPCSTMYLPVIRKLVKEGVKINVTLVFTALQSLIVAKLGVTYISPFIGRWDDIAIEGVDLVPTLVTLKKNYGFKSEILAASIRNILHWQKAAEAGADVVTLPPPLLEQALKHPLTERGIELFDNDWKKLGKKNLFD
jgi:transaldolase